MAQEATIGEFLKNARRISGRSLADVAREAEIGKSTLSTWERDLRRPCVPELDAALRALGVSPQERTRALGLIDAPRAARALGGAPGHFRPDLMVALRSRAGLSQGQLALRLGVHFSTVSRWERGHDEPAPTMMLRFAEAVGADGGEQEALARRSPFGRKMGIDELDALFSRFAFEAFRRKDVEFLLLREALRDMEHPEGKRLQTRVVVRYAQYLSESGRRREALEAIESANEMAREGVCKAELLLPAVLAEAALSQDPNRSLRILGTLGDRISYGVCVAWLAEERGFHLARGGYFDQAVASARHGVEIVLAGGWEVEIYFRQRGAARTYLRAGRLDEAQQAILSPRPERVQESSFDRFLQADLSDALGKPEAAAYHRGLATVLATAEGRLLC